MQELDDYLAKIKRPLNYDQLQLVTDAFKAGCRSSEVSFVMKLIRLRDKMSLVHQICGKEIENVFLDFKQELKNEKVGNE